MKTKPTEEKEKIPTKVEKPAKVRKPKVVDAATENPLHTDENICK